MNESRLERLAPLTGAISGIFLILGSVMIGIYEWLPPAEKIADFVNSNAGRVSFGGYLGALGGIFLIWFAGSVYSALSEREGGTGRMSMVAFGGGVAAAISLTVGFAAFIAAGVRGGAVGGIGIAEAITFYDFWGIIMWVASMLSFAVLIGATALVSLRAALFPAWFGWISALIALVLLTTITYFLGALVVVWLFVVSIWLYVKGTSAKEPSAVDKPA